VPRFRQQAKDESGATITTNFSGPYWSCNEVRLKAGRAPSYAIAHIPLKSTDETSPQIAGVRGGPLDGIKSGTPAAVYDVFTGNENLVMTGVVMNVRQDLKEDAASVVIMDHRVLLAGLKMAGQFHISGTSGVSYRQGLRCLMNEDGMPNCSGYEDGSGLLIPVFCPINYGLTAIAEPGELQVGKASYWTPSLALQYIRWFSTSLTAQSLRTDSTNANGDYPFAFLSGADSSIVWPPTYHEVTTGLNDVSASSVRKAREIDLEGRSVLDAISECAEMAGKFALHIRPTADYKGTIEIVPTRYSGGGDSIARATAGNANPVLNNCVFAAGTIEEDATDLFTMVAVTGERVFIERRFDTVSGSLSWAYTAADLSSWKTLQNGATPLTRLTRFEEANATYNKVFAALRVTTTNDYQAGTSEEGLPLANIGKPPLPSLLSSFLEGVENSATLMDRMNTPYAIRFEYSEDSGATWKMAEEQDGLSINPQDGTIWITGLRSIGRTFKSSGTTLNEKLSAVSSATPVDIRATLAMPTDHRLTAARKLTTDPTINVLPSTDTQDDNDRIEPGFSRLYYIDADRLYAKHIRYDAYPVPQSAGGSVQSAPIRDDSSVAHDYIGAHAQRKISELGRLKKTARIIYPLLYSLWRPGMAIKELLNIGAAGTVTSTVPVRAVCNEIVFKCGKMQNETALHLS